MSSGPAGGRAARPLAANVTNTTSLVFVGFGAAAGSRPELSGQRSRLVRLGALNAAGGLAGAVLLLLTPESAFEAAVPWLIASASITLLRPPRPVIRDVTREGSRRARLAVFAVAVYAGYFGAARRVLALAVLTALLDQPLARSIAMKNVISACAERGRRDHVRAVRTRRTGPRCRRWRSGSSSAGGSAPRWCGGYRRGRCGSSSASAASGSRSSSAWPPTPEMTVRSGRPAGAGRAVHTGRRGGPSSRGHDEGGGGRRRVRRLPRRAEPARSGWRGEAEIVLVNTTDYFLYLPLLPEVAAGVLEPRRVAVPLAGEPAGRAAGARRGRRGRPGRAAGRLRRPRGRPRTASPTTACCWRSAA